MINKFLNCKDMESGIFPLSSLDSLIGENINNLNESFDDDFDLIENMKDLKYDDLNKEIHCSVKEAESIINEVFNNNTFLMMDTNLSEYNENTETIDKKEGNIYDNLAKNEDEFGNKDSSEKNKVLSHIRNISGDVYKEVLNTLYNNELQDNINIDQNSIYSDIELFDDYTSFDYVFDGCDMLSVDDWENDEITSEIKYSDLIWPEENEEVVTDDEYRELNIVKNKKELCINKTPASENNNNLNINVELPTIEYDEKDSNDININNEVTPTSTKFRKWLSDNKGNTKIQSYFKILKNESAKGSTPSIINSTAFKYIFRGFFRKNYISNSSFNSNLIDSLSSIVNKKNDKINKTKEEKLIGSQFHNSINNTEPRRSLKQRTLPLKISTKYQINNRTRRTRDNDVGTIWLIREIYLSLTSQILKLSMSIDGEWLILGSQDGYIRQWKFKDSYSDSVNEPLFNEKEDLLIEAHSNAIISLQWENDENSHRFLSSSMDRTVKLWEAGNCRPFAVVNCSDWPTSVSFHPIQKDILFIGSLDASVQILKLVTKTKSYKDISNESDKLEVNHNNNKFMNLISTKNIHLKYQAKVIETIRVQDLLTTLSISPNGKYLACGFKDGGVAFYDARTLKYRCDVDCRNRRGKSSKGKKVSGICWRNDNKSILVTTNDSRVRLFNLSDLSTFVKFKGHVNKETLLSAQISNNEKSIFCGSENGYICIWDIQSEYDSFSLNNSYYKYSNYGSLNQSTKINSDQINTCLNRSNVRRGPTQHCVDSFKAFDSSLTSTILAPISFSKKIIKYFKKVNSITQKYPIIGSNINEKDLNVFIATNSNGQIRILVNIPN